MKLNNLSRLTALLMAMMMLCMCSAGAESGIDWSNLTGSLLADTDEAAALIEAGYCSLCVEEMAKVGITTWPAEGYTCLHDHLSALTAEEAYQYLYTLYLDYDDYYVYQAYINAHANHVTQATGDSKRDAVICYNNSCTTNPLTAPGPKHASDCLWYQVTEYVYQYPITTNPDVSTPDALAGLTEVILSFTATSTEGTVLTYTWQRTSTPDVADSWVAIDGANASTYTLAVTPAAMTYVYRCVVTDASGNVVSTSSTLYLGGKEFFAWVSSTEGEGADAVVISVWLQLAGNKMEYVLAAYAAYLKGIPLSEAIHVTTITETVDSTTVTSTVLLELLGLSTLAEIDAEGNVIDIRYHIAVATYDAETGTITALATN